MKNNIFVFKIILFLSLILTLDSEDKDEKVNVLNWNDFTFKFADLNDVKSKGWFKKCYESHKEKDCDCFDWLLFPSDDDIDKNKIESVELKFKEDFIKWVSFLLKDYYIPKGIQDKIIPLKKVTTFSKYATSDGFLVRFETEKYHIQIIDNRVLIQLFVLDKTVSEPSKDFSKRIEAFEKIMKDILKKEYLDAFYSKDKNGNVWKEKLINFFKQVSHPNFNFDFITAWGGWIPEPDLPEWKNLDFKPLSFDSHYILTDGKFFLIEAGKEYLPFGKVAFFTPESRFNDDALFNENNYKDSSK